MGIRLRATPVLLSTHKAAQIQLPSGRKIWLPLSQCPGLADIPTGREGEFECPQWIVDREDLLEDARTSSPTVQVEAQTLHVTQGSALVRFRGGEELWLPFDSCPGLSQIPVNAKGSFQCPAFFLNDRDLDHYTYSPMKLALELRKGTISPAKAVYTGKISPGVLHQFANDCAQKVLHSFSQMGTEITLCLWRALQVKRQWLQGEASLEELFYEREQIRSIWSQVQGSDLNAVIAAWDATDPVPSTAALGAARHLTQGTLDASVSVAELQRGAVEPDGDDLLQERRWQSQNLASLIEREESHQRRRKAV